MADNAACIEKGYAASCVQTLRAEHTVEEILYRYQTEEWESGQAVGDDWQAGVDPTNKEQKPINSAEN